MSQVAATDLSRHQMSDSPTAHSFIRKPLDHSLHFAARFGAMYFITLCCRGKRRNQLCHQQTARAIFKTVNMYDERGVWYLELMLLMPDHLHALIGIDGEASLSKIIGDFKRATSRFARVQWQRNLFDHRLRHDESLGEKAEYIRNNPVRAGLAAHEDDWMFVLDREKLDVAVR